MSTHDKIVHLTSTHPIHRVEHCDNQGRFVGWFLAPTAEERARTERRAKAAIARRDLREAADRMVPTNYHNTSDPFIALILEHAPY